MHSRSCWRAGAPSCCGAITGRDSAGSVTHASAAHRFPLFMIGPEGTTKATDVLLPFSSGAFVGGGACTACTAEVPLTVQPPPHCCLSRVWECEV